MQNEEINKAREQGEREWKKCKKAGRKKKEINKILKCIQL